MTHNPYSGTMRGVPVPVCVRSLRHRIRAAVQTAEGGCFVGETPLEREWLGEPVPAPALPYPYRLDFGGSL